MNEIFTELDISSFTYDYKIPFESFKQFEECFKLYKEKLK